jgi:hypothetical protein
MKTPIRVGVFYSNKLPYSLQSGQGQNKNQ